jgi:GAF domain-containing protein
MREDEAVTPPARLLSTTQAAHLIGVHRSSLHLAVKNSVLTPDIVTQGGHYRFSHATLDEYAEHIAHAPLTSNTDLLTLLPRMLTLADGKERLCRQTFALVERRIPDLTAYVVVQVEGAPDDSARPHVITSLRFPRTIMRMFIETYGKQEMTTSRVLASGQPYYCDNVRAQLIPYPGSQRLNRHSPYQAYAVLPLAVGNRPFGTLGVCSRVPHAFTPDDKEFLEGAAGSLAIALNCYNATHARQSRALALGRLLQASFAYRGKPVRRRRTRTSYAEELLGLFQVETAAEEVFVAGVDAPAPLEPRSESTRRLAAQVIRGALSATDQWEDDRGPLIGVAIAIPRGEANPIALGGAWRGVLEDNAEYSSLLHTFAGAYLLGSDIASA